MRYVERGRGGPDHPSGTMVKVRYVITEVTRHEEAIEQQKHRQGFRIYVTCVPVERMSLRQSHVIKDHSLGISPLYV